MSQSSTDHYRNPLKYQGQDYRFVPTYLRKRDPIAPQNASPDIKPPEQQGYYVVNSLWTNTTNSNVWMLVGITNNLGDWRLISSGAGTFDRILTPDGHLVPPVAGTFTFDSPNNTITISGNIATGTISFDALPVLDQLFFDLDLGDTPVHPQNQHLILTSSDSSIDIEGTFPNIIDLRTATIGTFTGLISGGDGQNVDPDPVTHRIALQSPDGTVGITKDGGDPNAIDFTALPAIQNHLKLRINGATDVSPTATDPSKFLFTASGGITLTNPIANTINFDGGGGGGGGATQFTADTGTAVPAAGNINVFRTVPFQASTSASGSTIKIKAPNCALFIVDADADYGTHTTIQSAITAASLIAGPHVVFIRPGTYTEDLVMQNNVNLSAFTSDQNSPTVTIKGKITLAAGAACSIQSMTLMDNGSNVIELTGDGKMITLIDSVVYSSSADTVVINGASSIILERCTTFLQALGICHFTATGTVASLAGIFLDNSILYNVQASTKQSVLTYVSFTSTYSIFHGAIRTENVCAFGAFNTSFETGIGLSITTYTGNCTGVSITNIQECSFGSGTATAIVLGAGNITLLIQCIVSSSATNAISGPGELRYSLLDFTGLSSTISVGIETVAGLLGPRLGLANGGSHVMSGSGNPGGVVTAPRGSIFLRSDAGATVNNRAYINTNGGTGWTAFLTAA
jgi:hypothetical protein